MIDLLKSHSKQKQSTKPQTHKQAFENAGVNSLLHETKQGNYIIASLYIEPLESLSNTPDNTKGRNRMLTVRQGRRLRARSLQRDSQAFFQALVYDVARVESKAAREGLKVVLRLPVLHGIEWPEHSSDSVIQKSFIMA